MAISIPWAFFCDLAFLDRYQRLCIVGLITKLGLPAVPTGLSQAMIVAKLGGAVQGMNVNFGFKILFPSGAVRAPNPSDNTVALEVAEDYLFIRLRDFPLPEVGVYKLILELNGANALTIELPVSVVGGGASNHGPQIH